MIRSGIVLELQTLCDNLLFTATLTIKFAVPASIPTDKTPPQDPVLVPVCIMNLHSDDFVRMVPSGRWNEEGRHRLSE